MAEIVLHMAPDSCSRVSLVALIEIGAAFETSLVRFKKGEHKSLFYKRLNPKGKVPLLVVSGQALTENVAIICYLKQMFPTAGLLPAAENPIAQARQIADLCFCSSTLHPNVTRLRMPGIFASPEASLGVWEKASTAMREHFQLIEERLALGVWWYGDDWSVMDVYLNWVFWRVEGAGFSVVEYPNFADHALRMAERPSYKRAMEIEAAYLNVLDAEGLTIRSQSLV